MPCNREPVPAKTMGCFAQQFRLDLQAFLSSVKVYYVVPNCWPKCDACCSSRLLCVVPAVHVAWCWNVLKKCVPEYKVNQVYRAVAIDLTTAWNTLFAFHISSVSTRQNVCGTASQAAILDTKACTHLCCMDTCLCLQLSTIPAWEEHLDQNTMHAQTWSGWWCLHHILVS